MAISCLKFATKYCEPENADAHRKCFVAALRCALRIKGKELIKRGARVPSTKPLIRSIQKPIKM